MLGFGALTSLTGGGGLAPSSSATASGGNFGGPTQGAVNIGGPSIGSPSGISPIVLIAGGVAALVAWKLLKR